MRIIIVLFLLAGISVNAQQNYKVGDTIKVDDNLTLIVTHAEQASIRDIKTQTMKFPRNHEIDEHYIGILGRSGFSPPLSGEVAKTVMQVFREVFTEDELNNFVKNATEFSAQGISFWIMVDLKGDIAGMSVAFWPKNPIIDAIPKEKIGKLYKLIVDRLKFNMRNTGLEYYGLFLRVTFKDVVNGTLDFSNLMRDINKGGYLNYYWKGGKMYTFE